MPSKARRTIHTAAIGQDEQFAGSSVKQIRSSSEVREIGLGRLGRAAPRNPIHDFVAVDVAI
jgi:hypothetical protein